MLIGGKKGELMRRLANWNCLDSFIYFCESMIKNIVTEQKEEAPDVETIIAAETEYLQRENENLKKREIPLYLIEENGQFLCPKCKTQHSDLDIKYCSNCGQRVIRRTVKGFVRDEIK